VLKKIFILTIVFCVSIGTGYYFGTLLEIRQEIERLEHKQEQLLKMIDEITERVEGIYDNLNGLLERVEVKEVNLSFYAPLDPNAVEGMCYSGNPEITASGERVIIGETVAAGPDIPYYTKVYLQGRGWYTVHDRGSRIGNDDLDVAVATRMEAFSNGRVNTTAVFFYPRNLQNESK